MQSKNPYAISAGHQSTLDAAKEILDNGGNAIDAAIAAYWTSMVAEPFMSSAGAGGFSSIYVYGKYYAHDWFCQTPQVKKAAQEIEFKRITVDFGDTTEDFYVGMGAVAVPGAIEMLFALHERWASIPMKDLVSHACNLANEGSILDPFQAIECGLLQSIYELDARGKELFLDQNAKPKVEGDRVAMEHFADFAHTIALEGKDLFYQGEVGQSLLSHIHQVGGHLSSKDLRDYKSVFRRPFSYTWNDHIVHGVPYPSVGAMILAALLYGMDQEHISKSKAQYEYLQRHISKVYEVGTDVTKVANMLREMGISVPSIDYRSHKWGGTSHFNIADGKGMAIALSTSIGEGCGYFIPGTDMQMNNMLGEMALLPNGVHSWEPDIRLQSMMCPTIISDQMGSPKLLIGSGGAGRIPYAMSQTIYHNLLQGLALDEAMRHPRIVRSGQMTHVESGFDIEANELSKIWTQSSLFFGGTHAIQLGQPIVGAGDHRRYGVSYQSDR